MSDGRLIYLIFLAYSALLFLGLAFTIGGIPSAPAWQSPALYCVSVYLFWLLWDFLRGILKL